MAPKPRVRKAFNAMKDIGIPETKVKPVLKNLLKLYDKNWEMIEEDNYRVLADAIFDEQESEQKKGKKAIEPEEDIEEEASVEPERPLKRLRRRGEGGSSALAINNSSPASDGTILKKPKVEEDALALSLEQQSDDVQMPGQSTQASERTETQTLSGDVGTKSPSPEPMSVKAKHLNAGPGILTSPKQKTPDAFALIIPKEEPVNCEMPLTMTHPDLLKKNDTSAEDLATETTNGQEPATSQNAETENITDDVRSLPSEKITNMELAKVSEESCAVEIASSPLGEVKISLSCSAAIGGPNFRMPSLDELRRSMEEKCLRSYKILDPSFSVMNLMKDMCNCFLELATNSSKESPERLPYITPNLDLLKRSALHEAILAGGNKDIGDMTLSVSNGPVPGDNCSENEEEKGVGDADYSNSHSLVVVPECQITADELRSLNDFNDITKGEERVEISWVNDINCELPRSFYYIRQSLVFQNAAVKVTLSQIGDEHCCSSCFGDCLTSTVPCACAYQIGGFAYTSEGLLKEDFLEECISMIRDPQRQCLRSCKECPLEKAKSDEILEPCKGHLTRKTIKECWSKCGCNKKCGNRVVQQGIHNKLQVFLTPDGKGWGLRTLEKLPKGAFVCEYAGEILTIAELYQRIPDKHTSPVILDAYWGSGEVSKDEKALCLDAMRFGNIARFINHRCLDANLIEVPVEMETAEHHYYHLAFFTTREIDAMEELTWDYGIDFDDHDHPVKVFQCLCGSKFCRNMKRANRTKRVLNGR